MVVGIRPDGGRDVGIGRVGGIALAVIAIWRSAVWVLGPLDQAARNRWHPVQFSLADFLCLFILVDLPMGGIHYCVPQGDGVTGGVIAADVVVVVLAALVWWTGVRTLSRAGIMAPGGAGFVLAVVIPVGYAGSCIIGCLPFFIIGRWLDNGDSPLAMKLTVAEIATGGVLYGLGHITRAVVASASGWLASPAARAICPIRKTDFRPVVSGPDRLEARPSPSPGKRPWLQSPARRAKRKRDVGPDPSMDDDLRETLAAHEIRWPARRAGGQWHEKHLPLILSCAIW